MQFFDETFWITLGAALLVSAAAFVVMRFYVGTILRESQRNASLRQGSPGEGSETRLPSLTTIGPLEIEIEKPDEAINPLHLWSSTFQYAETAFRRVPHAYALGGSVHAATSTGLLFLFGFYSLPSTPSKSIILASYAAVFWSWSFFTLVVLALFFGPDRRRHIYLALGYASMLPIMGVLLQLANAPALPFTDVGLMPRDEAALLLSLVNVVMAHSVPAATVAFSPLLQPALFWSLSAAPVTIPFLAFNRFIRGTVGPLFITLALLMTITTLTILNVLTYTPPGQWFWSYLREVIGRSSIAVLWTICLTLSVAVSWLGLVWIANRYRRKQLSDQTFLFDALWLSGSFWVSAYLMGDGNPFRYLLGLLPFILYKITVGYTLKRLTACVEPVPKTHLLFLRVFGATRRSEKLFDLLAARWRYAGSIQLISATDMARVRFEPDEFLDFLSGRLASAYISNDSDLDRRLATLDLRPDPDGRHRVNELFCHSDTWQQTVTRLMKQSDLVVMDLRTFISKRKGCIFELNALINEVLLNRIVLLIDQTTDELFLRETLADLWRKMTPQSPNASAGIARIRILNLAYGHTAAVHRLMQLADEVTAPTAP